MTASYPTRETFVNISISIMTIGICGAGTMGSGIAYAAAASGCDVLLHDVSDELLARGMEHVDRFVASGLERGKIAQEEAESLRDRIHPASEPILLAPCELVIEAIIEDLDIKRDLFERLEAVVSSGAILASNTSSLSITAIASRLASPERVVGMHFFNPAHIMKLVEVVQGYRTSPEVVARAVEIAHRMGKTPVIAKDTPGFIVNRVARNFYGEALRIVGERGATIEQVDRCMKGIGFRMGPFELMDLIGIDVNLAVTESVYAQFFNEPRFRPHPIQRKMVESGLLGKKSGGGFYTESREG